MTTATTTTSTSTLLESCSLEDICKELEGSVQLLADLTARLKDWLELQPHLPQGMPERRLEFFVYSSKLSLERAKKKLDMYYTVRHLVPEIFTGRDPLAPWARHNYNIAPYYVLPKLTPEKYRVSIIRFNDIDASQFQPWESMKYSFLIADILITEFRYIGDVFIYDLLNCRLGHFMKVTPTMVKKLEVVTTKAYGSRIKAIHFINAPSFIDRIVTLIKSVLKPKLAERIHVHSSSIESLYEHIPKSLLPIDYGGEQPAMDDILEKWRVKVEEYRDWFLKEEKLYVDESLRPGPSIDVDDLFGIHGSFRKLEVD